MIKRILIVLVVLLIWAQVASAGRMYAPRQDNRVVPLIKSTSSSTAAKSVTAGPGWANTDTRVTKWGQRKYDANKDGYLQPAEARQMLKDRYSVLAAKPNPKVNDEIEAYYDKNNNGYLEKAEVDALKKDIR